MLKKFSVVFNAMVRKNFLVMLRYPMSFFGEFMTSFTAIFTFYFAGRAFVPVADPGIGAIGNSLSFDSTMFYGMILFLFTYRTLWLVGLNVRTEQYQGTLESLYLSPAPRFFHLISRLLEPLCWGLITSAAILIVIAIISRPLPMHNIFLALYTLVFTLSGIFGIAFVFGGLALLIKETAFPLATFTQFVLLLLCAFAFPFKVLPGFVRIISRFIPLSYGVDLFRSSLMDFPPGFPELAGTGPEMIIIAAWGIGMLILSYFFYQWAARRVRINGSLAMY